MYLLNNFVAICISTRVPRHIKNYRIVGNFCENAVFASGEIFVVFILRKQDASIDHAFECQASLPSLHVNEKSTLLLTSLGQGISSVRTAAQLSL